MITTTRPVRIGSAMAIIGLMCLLCICTGCKGLVPSPPADTLSSKLGAAASPTPCTVVYGVDVTGSYKLTNEAFVIAADDVMRYARQYDNWYLRQISDKSYDEAAVIDTLSGYQMGGNSGAEQGGTTTRREQQLASTFAKRKSKTAELLMNLKVVTARRTDINSFLAKAGELLAVVPPEQKKVIVICSDMEDNMGRESAINLHGAQVLVRVFQGGTDAAKVQARKEEWSGLLKDWGASNVTMLDPKQPVPPGIW